MQSIGLYVHIPFCRSRCDYCDFISMVAPKEHWEPYVDALVHEIEHWSPWLKDCCLNSVYFGGGTPTLIGSQRLARILSTVRSLINIEASAEVSVEANPDTVSPQMLSRLRKAGFNRLSFGVQSFQPMLLRRLNRKHSRARIEQCMGWARKSGFENVSLDLIYGIPGQSKEAWSLDLETAAHLEPEHLSMYELTLEPWTPMGRRIEARIERLPDEDTVIAMYEWAQEYLPRMGLEQYEISNFSRPGKQCVHNLNTWRQGEYLGLGLAAHSYLHGKRFRNACTPQAYLSHHGPESDYGDEAPGHYDLRYLNPQDKWSETLILGLRLVEGVDLEAAKIRLGVEIPETMRNIVLKGTQQELLERQGGRIRLTTRGMLLSDSLFSELVI